MRWRDRRESSNVEDLRSEAGPVGFGGGRFSLLSLPIGLRAKLLIGLGLVVLALISGGDPVRWLNGDFSMPQRDDTPQVAAHDDAKRFAAVVLADTEDVWGQIFKERGMAYVAPKLVLFRDGVQSGCGATSAAVGPFYCPNDSKVYVDLGFLVSLQGRLGATGDFAEAYIIAHEVGHHVQYLLGKLDSMDDARGSNGTQVRMELQADCYAGVWVHYTERMQHSLDSGDIEEAMNAASAVGDDRIQKRAQGYVVPDSFTHGTSAQRQHWFTQGYETGKMEVCDTFGARGL
jgi:predicted metalloprotease